MKIYFKVNNRKYILDTAKFISAIVSIISFVLFSWVVLSTFEIFCKNLNSIPISDHNFWISMFRWFV